MLPGVTVQFHLGFTAPAVLGTQPFTIPNGSMGAQHRFYPRCVLSPSCDGERPPQPARGKKKKKKSGRKKRRR